MKGRGCMMKWSLLRKLKISNRMFIDLIRKIVKCRKNEGWTYFPILSSFYFFLWVKTILVNYWLLKFELCCPNYWQFTNIRIFLTLSGAGGGGGSSGPGLCGAPILTPLGSKLNDYTFWLFLSIPTDYFRTIKNIGRKNYLRGQTKIMKKF
jgi:hypothetical protein